MIEFTGVSKRYGDTVAVDSISLRVEAGEVCVLIGPSGCGKTTTLKMVNRMLNASSGVITIDGRDVASLPVEQLRRSIGYVIQSVGLLPHLSVRDNIAIVPRLNGVDRRTRYKRADELLDLIGLDPAQYRLKYPHELSGGEAQRIGVARALAADPPILLMDEPFGAVDPLNREVLQTEFLRLQRALKKTVMFVTHDLDEAIRIADTVILIKDGRIVQHATPEQILARPRDQFVRDFVGKDRALKRLSCFAVRDYIRQARQISQQDVAAYSNGEHDEEPVVWVNGPAGVLVGVLQRITAQSGAAALSAGARASFRMISLKPEDVGVAPMSSMKEALSRLLGQGMRAVPVLDERNCIIGEVRLPDIEELNQAVL
ncbi:MAG: ABC transporter ATP-binding protein [Spirochaetaceae bacterium]|nr:MAG: ABC transporter ATP-binding protein [Spirochaetaceae bacterium]